MKRFALGIAMLFGALSPYVPAFAMEEDVGEVIGDTTQQYKQEDVESKEKLAGTSFFDDLQPFGFNTKAATTADIKASLTMPNLSRGDAAKRYDIVLQPGHYLRKPPGKMGASGAEVTEQQLVAFITANVAKHLVDGGMNVLVVSADEWQSTLNADIFLSIHADGSERPCTTGPSLGYGQNSNLLGMHGIAFALATSMGQTYEDFMNDNFTTNLSKYYMFKHIKLPSKGFSGVLEVGELTCPDMEKALVANALLISKNLGVALKSFHEIIVEPLDGMEQSSK